MDKNFVNFLKSYPPLDSDDLIKLLSDCPIFGGVYSCDNLPKRRHKRPVAYIVNTQASNKPGEHWQVIFLRADGVGEFFDPFGFPPDVKRISDYLDAECDGWGYIPVTLQHSFAVSCGLYCVNFIRARQSGLTYAEVYSQFSQDLTYNELYIYNYGIEQFQRTADLWYSRLPRLHN